MITPKYEKCNYCGKIISIADIKAQKRVKNPMIDKITICKLCWSNIEKRKIFKKSDFVVL
jgi:thioredoxin-related protein